MNKAENLGYMIRLDGRALRALLEDITEDESLVQGKDKLNHIRWLTGHLVYETNFVLQMLGCPPSALPETYEKLFDAGSELQGDPKVYPPMAQLRSELYELHDRVAVAVAGLSDEALDEQLPKEIGFEAQRLQGATFMAMHTFYHCGQIAVIRRILGRPRAFR